MAQREGVIMRYPKILNEYGYPLIVLGPPHAGLSPVLSRAEGHNSAHGEYLRGLPAAKGAVREAGVKLLRDAGYAVRLRRNGTLSDKEYSGDEVSDWKRPNGTTFQPGDYRPRTRVGTFYKKGTDILRVDDVGHYRRGGRLTAGDWSVVFLGTLTDVPKEGPSPYALASHYEMKPYEIERNGYRKIKPEKLNASWRAFFARYAV
jgi:hypothetical protein